MNECDFAHVFLKKTPISYFIKDQDGKYVFVNQITIQTTGFENESALIGSTDFDLPWREQALQIYNNDQKIIQCAQADTYIEFGELEDKSINYYLSYKLPYCNHRKVIGVQGYSILIENKKNQLSKMQVECLYYFVLGMTSKEIARKLSLSSRTVEHYIENIKIKLNCSSRSELVTQALCQPIIKYRIAILTFSDTSRLLFAKALDLARIE